MYHSEKTAARSAAVCAILYSICSARHILEGRFEDKSNKDPRVVSFLKVLDGFDHRVCSVWSSNTVLPKVPHTWPLILSFAAIADLSASLRRKYTMRSGLWPPVGLASGVICPAFEYCSTGLGTAAAAMCATTCTNKSLFTTREPKSYPMFRAHAEWSWFTESWHLSEW